MKHRIEMKHTKKQMKITKLFRKRESRLPSDCEELLDEIQELEQKLKEKHDDLFQLQRSSYKHKSSPPKMKSESFVKPENIILTNSVETLKQNINVMWMMSGMEVQSYMANEHCDILFHMQHNAKHELTHGLRIDMKNGDNVVSKSSLPVGFNLSAVLDGFSNVMHPQCLGGVRKALAAYYDRLDQFEQLKKMLNIEAQLFKMLDGSHIEITFTARSEHDTEDDQFEVKLILDYRVYDIRPKQYSFMDIDMPQETVENLRDQCAVFKKKPLHKAFKEAFIKGNGTYIMVHQIGTVPAVQRRRRKPKRQPANPCYDDTFQPEDCSESDNDAYDD